MTNEELQQAIAWFENRLSSATMPGTRKMFGMALLALRERQEREKEHIGEATNMIPKPVVHGEWVEAKVGGMSLYPDGQKMCSVCGQIMPSRWETMPPFCFGCGAKMNAESEDSK